MHVHPGKAILRAFAAVLLTLTFATAAYAEASIWPSSRTTFFDIDGQPAVGWTAEFFNCETSTPQTVYEDGGLGVTLDQPVESDARGMFPSIFLSPTPGCYRVRVEDADGALVYDDDLIAVPQAATFTPPDAGETAPELLLQTGDMILIYGTAARTGTVRCNGRTIGNASSGATERANDDVEDLYLLFWTVDATLTVSTGRGASAASDFAANKTIALPDCRDRTLSALATMGNSDAGLVADAYVDGGEDSSDLGATAGVDDVTLSVAEMPAHAHPGTSFSGTPVPDHTHLYPVGSSESNANIAADGSVQSASGTTSAAGGHTPAGSVTVASQGGGTAHNNMAPTMFVTVLIKL